MRQPIAGIFCIWTQRRALSEILSAPSSVNLAFLIHGVRPEHPEAVLTPLVHALAARALDAEVEIHFAGPAVRYLCQNIAHNCWPHPGQEKSLSAWLDEAQAAGVQFFACSMAQAAWLGANDSLRAEVKSAGATAFVARSLDPAWRTLVY